MNNNSEEIVAGIYVRVSTTDQVREGHSYEEQERILKNLCENRGFKVYAVYGDPGMSGKYLKKRKNLQHLLNDIRDRKINAIVMWRLDRLVRGVSNTQTIIDVAKEYNCELITAMLDLDYKSASGKYMINMEAAHGEYELDVISERTKLGLRKAIAKGHLTKVPFGYMRDENGPDKKKVIINPEEAPIVKRLFELYLDGASCQETANKLNEEFPNLEKPFKRRKIECMVINENYAGIHVYNKGADSTGEGQPEIMENVVEPIITMQEMEKVKKRNQENRIHYAQKETYLFLRKIKCPNCSKEILGGTHGVGRHGGVYHYYQCNRCKTTGLVSEKKLEEQFIREIDYIIDYFIIADIGTIPIRQNPYMVGDAKNIENNLDTVSRKEERIKQAYFNELIEYDEFQREMTAIKARKERLQKEMKKQTRNNIRIPNDMDVSVYATLSEIQKRKDDSYFAKTLKTWNRLSEKEKQKIIAEYIDSIEIKLEDGNVSIAKINIKDKKIVNFAYMFRKDIMDMTIKKEERNILISKPKKQKEITEFVKEISKFYNISVEKTEINDIGEINPATAVKIIPIYKTRTHKEQMYAIITI